MKQLYKVWSLILALALVLALPLTAQAAPEVLQIDNAYVYPGMDAAYNAGYVPAVKEGKVQIVLPLISTQPVTGDTLQVSVDLGDANTAPFVFGNYNKTVSLATHTLGDGTTRQAYLIDFILPLAEGRVNGKYPVILQVSGSTAEGAFTQSFPLYVTVTDGASAELEEPEVVKPASQPKLMITGYTTTPTPVMAGEPFQLEVTLKNTSSSYTIRNLKLEVRAETNEIYPTSGTNTFFFNKVGTGKSVSFTIDLQTMYTLPQQPQTITVNMSYEGKDAQAYTASESILVQVKQNLRVEMDPVKLPESVYTGETITLPINVMNLSRAPVHNVRAALQVNGLLSETSAFLGTIEAGASKQDTVYAFATGTGAAGNEQVSGMLLITYEDEFGEQFSKEMAVQTTIQPQVIAPSDTQLEQEAEEQQVKQQWWIAVVVIGAVLLAIGVVLTLRAKAKKREDHAVQ